MSKERDSRSLGGVAGEFGELANSIRKQLNNLSKGGYLVWNGKGNIIGYSAIDKIIDNTVNKMISRLGQLEGAFIIGDYAKGRIAGSLILFWRRHQQ